jgi:hypothetical protein
MKKEKFIKISEFYAVKFDPNEYPWHHSVKRNTINGKIPNLENYFCIVPCDRAYTIRPGDWIIVDDINNAQGVISEKDFKMMGIKRAEN